MTNVHSANLRKAAEHIRDGGQYLDHEALDAAADALEQFTDSDGFMFNVVVLAKLKASFAMQTYPQPNYVITKVAEEAGEVVKAAVHCAEGRETAENVRSEMVDLMAMLYRLWVEGDEVHGLPPMRGYVPIIR